MYSLQGQKGEALQKLEQLQHKFEAQTQFVENKKQEIDLLDSHVADMQIAWRREESFTRQKEENLQLKEQVLQHHKEVAELQTECLDLQAGRVTGVRSLATQTRTKVPEASKDPTYPIISKEKHTLAAGGPRKLLNEL